MHGGYWPPFGVFEMANRKNSNPAFGTNGPACPKCGSSMSLKNGKYGMFWGCDKWRETRCNGLVNMKGTGNGYRQVAAPVARPTSIAQRKGSKQQEAIWNWMQTGSGHAVVHARAGCGKTFTLLQGAIRFDLLKTKMVYLAFNSSIARECLGKSPAALEVKTMNAYGHQLLIASKTVRSGVQVSRDKYSNLFNEKFPPQTENEIRSQGSNARKAAKLVELSMNYMLPCVSAKGAVTIEKKQLELVATKHGVEFDDASDEARVMSAVPSLIEKGMNIFSVITFEEQMWMPIVHNLVFPKQDWVLVDEAQDLNKLKQVFAMKALQKATRCLAVGDINQAIYGFMGADAASMKTTAEMLAEKDKVSEFKLNRTFRCGKAIVAFCQTWVPDFEADESNPEGLIVETDDTTAENDGLFKPGTMAVCRLNAPIVKIAYRLIGKGIPVHFIGRDFGKSIVGLIKALNPTSVIDLYARVEAYLTKERARLNSKKKKGRDIDNELENLEDRTSCVLVFAGKMDKNASICELISTIEGFFRVNEEENGNSKEAQNAVRLSSIHRAKGLECDTVLWLYPEIELRVSTEEQQQQEDNLRYVASSRAINTLILVRKDPNGVNGDVRDSHDGHEEE